MGEYPMRVAIALLCGASCVMTSCARTPDVTVNYYLPRADARLKVLETVSCNKQDEVVAAASGTLTTSYVADTTKIWPVHLKSLNGALADSGITFEFSDDGRLKGVNQSSTGKGEEVLKSAMTLLSAAFAFDGGAPPKFPKECSSIKQYGEGKPITIAFEGTLPLDPVDPAQTVTSAPAMLAPDEIGTPYFREIVPAVGLVCVMLTKRTMPAWKPADAVGKAGDVMLMLRQPATVDATAYSVHKDDCSDRSVTNAVWTGAVQVPQLGREYPLVIPRPVIFGKQVFGLTLSDAGTITKLQYDKETGAAQVLNVATAATNALVTTTEEETAKLKAERENIAEQEKIVACKADHTKCGG